MPPWEIELCSDIRSTPSNWLWPGYLPRGKVVLLDGDPGMGKSMLTIDLVARLSCGVPFPDGSRVARPVTSILLSAEDDAGDTIKPRLQAAGADLARIVIPNFGHQLPRLPDHVTDLDELIRATSAELVVIDPLMAFLPPHVAANLDQCVRQALSPLVIVAARTGCTILLVRHLTKKPSDRAILRGQGSMGIMAAVRAGLFVAPHPDDPESRVLAVAKSNLAKPSAALVYRIVPTPSGHPVVEWMGPVEQTADALCQKKVSTLAKPRDRAIDWLKRELANGPRKAADVYASAAAIGIPERTLDRAKQSLSVKSHRDYDFDEERGEWYWYDSDAPWPEDAPFEKPYEFPPLPLPGR